MAIIQATSSITGLVGVQPNFIFLNTTDTLGVVTTAGYLTKAVKEELIQISVPTKINPGGTLAFVNTTTGPVILSVVVTGIAPNLVYSLVEPVAGGGAIFEGPVQAGSNGIQGYFISYPATVNSGNFTFEAVASPGGLLGYDGTFSNAPLGQNTTWTLPDPGNAAARVLVAATNTPFVANHSIVASGTTGLVADAGYQLKTVAQAAVAGGAAAQTVVDAFCTAASCVVACWNDTTNVATIQKVAAGVGQFIVTSSADPGASHISYIITKV